MLAPAARPRRVDRYRKGRARLRWKVLGVTALVACIFLWRATTTSNSDTITGHGLRQSSTSTSPAASAERQLQSQLQPGASRGLSAANDTATETCGGAALSVTASIVGSKDCGRTGLNKCDVCCTDFDMYGGVVVYFAVMLYMFLGLAIICDDYFCESLDAISEALNLSEDVAGATFMAAGSSAPELFTAIVTILITGGSEGLGTIVGSAIFNIMIIVGVTAIFAGQKLKVWWYPLCRDCLVYFLSIGLMVWAIFDKKVPWWKSLVLILCYFGYIAIMVFNSKLVAKAEQLEKWWADRKLKKTKGTTPTPASGARHIPLKDTERKERGPRTSTNEEISRVAALLAARSSMDEGDEPSKAPAGTDLPTPGTSGSQTLEGGSGGSGNAWVGSAVGSHVDDAASDHSSVAGGAANQSSPSLLSSARVAPAPLANGGVAAAAATHLASAGPSPSDEFTSLEQLESGEGSSPKRPSVPARLSPISPTAAAIAAAGDQGTPASAASNRALLRVQPGLDRPASQASISHIAPSLSSPHGSYFDGSSPTPQSPHVPDSNEDSKDIESAAASASAAAASKPKLTTGAPSAKGMAAVNKLFGGGGAGGGAGASAAAAPAPAPAPAPAAESKHRKRNPMLSTEYRRVWGGNENIKKKRHNKRAAKQFRVQMKVAVATSRFKGALARARARAAARAAQGAGAGAGAGAAGAAAATATPAAAASKPSGNSLLAAMAGGGKAKAEEESKKKEEEEEDEDEDESPSCMDKFLMVIGWPMAKAMQYTVPNCAEKRWEKWYFVTFLMSIFWIGLLSYGMVDAAGRAGCVLKVPGLVMGLVVLAAGTSVPDALSSMLVAKMGQGDMAVANVLGSNVFNILLGLGLPWMVRALIDGHPVILPAEEEIVQPVLVLLIYLAFFIGVIACLKWTLTKTLGAIFIAGHFVFLIWNLLTLLPDPVIKL